MSQRPSHLTPTMGFNQRIKHRSNDKRDQSSLYNVIEYDALKRFMSNAGGNHPFPPDVCTHKSFDFTYTIIPVYEGDELIPREFIIDMFASDGYAKHLVVSNGVPGKTIDYRTGAIN